MCVYRGERERKENKQTTPKCYLVKCVMFERTMKLCRGRDTIFYLLKHPPEVSVEFITLYSLLGLQLHTADIPASSLRVMTAVPNL